MRETPDNIAEIYAGEAPLTIEQLSDYLQWLSQGRYIAEKISEQSIMYSGEHGPVRVFLCKTSGQRDVIAKIFQERIESIYAHMTEEAYQYICNEFNNYVFTDGEWLVLGVCV